MTSFARATLPVLLSPPSLNRWVSLSLSLSLSLRAGLCFLHRLTPALVAAWRSSGLEHGAVGAGIRWPSNVRHASSIWSSPNEPSTEGVPKSVPARVAHELLQAGHRYLDVRTVDEFNAGHPVGAVNVPYMFNFESGMTKNSDFLEQVSSMFRKDDEIVVGCQSGKRSHMAVAELSSAGYTAAKDVAGGYSAWVQNGLPINQ